MRFATIGRAMLAATTVLALGACFDREGRNESTQDNAAVANESGNEAASEDDSSARREPDAEMLREIRSEVADYRRSLPDRGDPITTTDVELDGSELIYTQRSTVNLTSEQADRLEREVTRSVCRGNTGRWIRGGVTMVYRITDPDGDDYRISIDECPESSGDDSSERERPASRDSGSARGEEGAADPALAEELARDIEQFRSQLPQRDGPLTTYDVELQGTEIIYFQRTQANLTDESFGRFERGIGAELCRGRGTAQMIRRGGSMTYRITDSEGEVFRTTVRSCP